MLVESGGPPSPFDDLPVGMKGAREVGEVMAAFVPPPAPSSTPFPVPSPLPAHVWRVLAKTTIGKWC